MTVQIKRLEREALFFITFTCYKWQNLFEITDCYDSVYKWFAYMKTQGILTAGFVILPNHLHALIYLPAKAKGLDIIVGNGKRFIAYEVVKRLRIMKESDLLEKLSKSVKPREARNGKLHQVFEPSFDAQLCVSGKFTKGKLDYIHRNPVKGKWQLAESYLDYVHSSACFYEYNEEHELVELTSYLDLI
ncbi:hypothetical protein LAG90_00575 [Marinilongibacter aquaticus]|uniref:hypothetical protein n=1 Tax=Marinilongibacter aquaticus TaxID=2975157 RepID=UPI0021BDAFE2|nr:hypothetical protein [Marinilongibacter aquaticus]UBM59153.1 hypothetical protein LAG90_00575 [Marinilongibacter aquaticus]